MAGQTDFTGIVNSIQMLTQIAGQGTKVIDGISGIPGSLLPSPSSNPLDMIRVNAAGTAYELRTPAQVAADIGLPPQSPTVALDMARINAAGTAYEGRTLTQVISDLGLLNTAPIGLSASTTGSSISVTTSLFTAPSAGVLMLNGMAAATSAVPNSAAITTSLAGLVNIFAVAGPTNSIAVNAFSYLPMSAAQSTTATFTCNVSGITTLTAGLAAFFLPQA